MTVKYSELAVVEGAALHEQNFVCMGESRLSQTSPTTTFKLPFETFSHRLLELNSLRNERNNIGIAISNQLRMKTRNKK